MGTDRLAGLLLAGGRSTRFGSDKALAVVGGSSLLARAEACLRAACDGPVLVASGDGRSRPRVGDGQVADLVAGAGPLSAIAAGLAALAGDARNVAVLAVDHVRPSAALFALLADQPGDPACTLAEVDGRLQPLHAVWSTHVADELAASVRDGDRSVVAWLRGRSDVRVLTPVALRDAGIPADATHDADVPDDLPN